MHREILFRGKRLDNGEWVYGNLVRYANGDAEGHVKLDYPENVAMNLTLNEIRERVVLKLRGVQ